MTNAQLFALDVDMLIPAALENQITIERAGHSRQVVIESANIPTTPDAHRHLHERGVFVVPILANSSGVRLYFSGCRIATGSWTEKGSQLGGRSRCRRRSGASCRPR